MGYADVDWNQLDQGGVHWRFLRTRSSQFHWRSLFPAYFVYKVRDSHHINNSLQNGTMFARFYFIQRCAVVSRVVLIWQVVYFSLQWVPAKSDQKI
jgi:hypothetical protein